MLGFEHDQLETQKELVRAIFTLAKEIQNLNKIRFEEKEEKKK